MNFTKEIIEKFKGKTLLITGGTGSFGNAVLQNFIDFPLKEIRIFSRDEKKQHEMRKKYNNEKIKFYVGDVRDYNSIYYATKNVDYVFHAAALKQVPSCEFYPMQAVKTNIFGANNLLDSCIENKVKNCVVLSTDKAVYPINAMGISKAMMEKLMISKSRNNSNTIFCATRYGNVMASRGSVIPLFYEQILKNEDITITDPNMTRYLMTLQESVQLVVYAFLNSQSGDIFVQKAPAVTIETLAEAMKKMFKSKSKIKIIGTRHGEKLFETLVSREEIIKSEDLGNFYRIPSDNRSLNYDLYFSKGEEKISKAQDYTSHNTHRLDINGTIEKLNEIDLKNMLL